MTETERNLIIDITGIKKDLVVFQKGWDKFELTIDKISEAVSTISNSLRLHDQKFEYQEEKDRLLADESREIVDRFEILSKCVSDMGAKMDVLAQQMKTFEEDDKEENKKDKETGSKMEAFNKYFWLILGGIAVIGWELSNIPVVKLISSWFDGTTGALPPK